jgi:hypothetical protein
MGGTHPLVTNIPAGWENCLIMGVKILNVYQRLRINQVFETNYSDPADFLTIMNAHTTWYKGNLAMPSLVMTMAGEETFEDYAPNWIGGIPIADFDLEADGQAHQIRAVVYGPHISYTLWYSIVRSTNYIDYANLTDIHYIDIQYT